MKSKYLAGILLLIAALSCAALFFAPKNGLRADIYLDGELVETVDLSALRGTYRIRVGDGNTVEAEHGRIRMLEADCPDGLCVGMGWSSSAAKPIVCLPNRVTVIIEGGGRAPDAVSGR